MNDPSRDEVSEFEKSRKINTTNEKICLSWQNNFGIASRDLGSSLFQVGFCDEEILRVLHNIPALPAHPGLPGWVREKVARAVYSIYCRGPGQAGRQVSLRRAQSRLYRRRFLQVNI